VAIDSSGREDRARKPAGARQTAPTTGPAELAPSMPPRWQIRPSAMICHSLTISLLFLPENYSQLEEKAKYSLKKVADVCK